MIVIKFIITKLIIDKSKVLNLKTISPTAKPGEFDIDSKICYSLLNTI